MNKPIVYIQNQFGEPMYEHCLAAWQGFKWLGYDVRFFSDAFGPVLPLAPDMPIVGSVEVTQQIFQANSKQVPKPLNIPSALMPFAGRPVLRMELGMFLQHHTLPAFVKPATTCKLWTGGVVSSKSTGQLLFSEYPQDTPVLVSPEVDFESEYRVFVSRTSGIVAVKHYSGDPFVTPDCWKINQMIAAYKDAPRCYSLDVGVIGQSEAETVIVECNDFWALGTYGFDPVKYAEMLAFRWHEMITQLK